jgi:hypothetical protein
VWQLIHQCGIMRRCQGDGEIEIKPQHIDLSSETS